MRDRLAVIIATWFGSGLIRPVFLKGLAGTYGSLAALPLCYVTIHMSDEAYTVILIVIYTIGWWSIPYAETALGARVDWHGKTKLRDQNQVVIDEVVGMLISVYPLIWFSGNRFFQLGVAFAAFRFFDIVKVPPTKYFDEMKTAAGVILDDVVAGCYAALTLTAYCAVEMLWF